MYLLPIIAVSGLRCKMIKDDNVELIEDLGYLLAAPHREWKKLETK